jgi:hypothetical protein
MDPPRGYVSGTEPNQVNRRKRMRTKNNGTGLRQSRKKGSAED